MKREVVYGFTLLVVCLFILNSVSAVSIDSINEQAKSIGDSANQLTNPSDRADLIAEQQQLFFTNTSLGKGIVAFGNGVQKVNPLWRVLFGVSFSLGEIILFVSTIVLWVFLLIYIFDFLTLYIRKWWVKFLSSLIIVVGISFIGVTKYVASLLINLINLASNVYVQVFSYLLVFIALIVLAMYLNRMARRAIRERREGDREMNILKEGAAITQNLINNSPLGTPPPLPGKSSSSQSGKKKRTKTLRQKKEEFQDALDNITFRLEKGEISAEEAREMIKAAEKEARDVSDVKVPGKDDE